MSIRSILSCLLVLAVSVSCSRDPNVIKARYLQNGNKYFERGKYKEASIMYRTALQKDAKYGEAYYRLALTDLKAKQPYAAVMSFRRAVELLKPNQPERMDARIKLADVYLDYLESSAKRDAEIVNEVDRTADDLIRADPKSLDGHRLRGRMAFIWAQDAASKKDATKMKERLASAIAEFRLANSLDPNLTTVVVYLARVLTADQQYGEAEKLYQGLVDSTKELNTTISTLNRLVEQWEQEGVSLKLH